MDTTMTGIDSQQIEAAGNGESLDNVLNRLRHVRRRLERWMPSSHSLALLSTDYSAVFGAAKRLEASVCELDSGIETLNNDPHEITTMLESLLEKLERSANEFEDSILRTAAA